LDTFHKLKSFEEISRGETLRSYKVHRPFTNKAAALTLIVKAQGQLRCYNKCKCWCFVSA